MKIRRHDSPETLTLREALRKLGDAFDTDEINEQMRYFWTKAKTSRSNEARFSPKDVFGKNYGNHKKLPNTVATQNLLKNLVVLRSIAAASRDVIAFLECESDADIRIRVDDLVGPARLRLECAESILRHEVDLRKPIAERDSITAKDWFPHIAGTPNQRAPCGSDAVPVSGATLAQLLQLALLDEDQMASSPEHWRTADGQARLSMRFFELGMYRESIRCAQAALKQQPDHGLASYVHARLLLAEAAEQRRAAHHDSLVSEATSNDESGLASDALAEESLQHAGAAAAYTREALPLLIRALTHWPRSRGQFDHREARLAALREVVTLAVQVSLRRRAGAGLGLAQSDDTGGHLIDRQMLQILLENEKSRSILPRESFMTIEVDLQWLQLYWLLDAAEYNRFAAEWVRVASQATPLMVNPTCDTSAFLEHLLRLCPDLQSFDRTVSHLRDCSMRYMSDWWAIDECRVLRSVMVAHYRAGELEKALGLADRIRSKLEVVRSEIHLQPRRQYTCIRILYDLSRQAMRKSDVSAAIKCFNRIADDFSAVIDTFNPDQPSNYLESLDEDDSEFADELGNNQDIFGRHDFGLNAAAPAPLRVLLDEILSTDSISGSDRRRLGSFLASLPGQSDTPAR